jgi:hypothetical protein
VIPVASNRQVVNDKESHGSALRLPTYQYAPSDVQATQVIANCDMVLVIRRRREQLKSYWK